MAALKWAPEKIIRLSIDEKQDLTISSKSPKLKAVKSDSDRLIEDILKNTKGALHYTEIRKKIIESSGMEISVRKQARWNRNLVQILQGVYIHKNNYNDKFRIFFDSFKTNLASQIKELIEDNDNPVPIDFILQDYSVKRIIFLSDILYIVPSICSLKFNNTTMLPNYWKTEIFDTTKSMLK